MSSIGEECEHYLRTYVSELSDEQAIRRGESLCAAFQKMLLVGHEHCTHPITVQVLAIPLRDLKKGVIEIPRDIQDKAVFRLFMDAHDGFSIVFTMPEIQSSATSSVAVSVMPPRQTNFAELLLNGIRPQQIIEGLLKVVHTTLCNNMATQAPASA